MNNKNNRMILNTTDDILTFGKYKGKKVNQTDGYWLRWAVSVGAITVSNQVSTHIKDWIESVEEMKSWGSNSVMAPNSWGE